ncbi:alpha/beta-hydrolase [Trichodelitschia bisporula]|uniref:Alpha/beta-hydrolase n=1 Tax=Trichodelitschia bisporula TaxID=703511 RepID=A0A6G1IBY5_9PEZI|nr:alpha/beta-hydrolase [Trichodelitschia bisporula]
MTNHSLSSCCLSGKVRSGQPTGKEETIAGLPTYVALPESGDKSQAVFFMHDVFGWGFPNVRMLADSYAYAGIAAFIPDLHADDSLPIASLQDVDPPLAVKENLSAEEKKKKSERMHAAYGPWLGRHGDDVTVPRVDAFIAALKEMPGVKKIGALGFCWGAKYVLREVRHGTVDAGVACHPSLVSVPGDFEGIQKPLSVACGTKDSMLSMEEVVKIQETLAKASVPSEVRLYKDQVHGFALRGDWSSDADAQAMDEAEQQGIAWFKKYLD